MHANPDADLRRFARLRAYAFEVWGDECARGSVRVRRNLERHANDIREVGGGGGRGIVRADTREEHLEGAQGERVRVVEGRSAAEGGQDEVRDGGGDPGDVRGGGRGGGTLGDPGEPAHEREGTRGGRGLRSGARGLRNGARSGGGGGGGGGVDGEEGGEGDDGRRVVVPGGGCRRRSRGVRARERAAEIRRAAGAAKRVDERGDVHGIEVRVRGGGETDGEDATRPLALQHVPEQARAIPLRVAHRGDGILPGRGCRRDGGRRI